MARRMKLEHDGTDLRFSPGGCHDCFFWTRDVVECYTSNNGYFCKGGCWVKEDAGVQENLPRIPRGA
jgi:hypothetical protein